MWYINNNDYSVVEITDQVEAEHIKVDLKQTIYFNKEEAYDRLIETVTEDLGIALNNVEYMRHRLNWLEAGNY